MLDYSKNDEFACGMIFHELANAIQRLDDASPADPAFPGVADNRYATDAAYAEPAAGLPESELPQVLRLVIRGLLRVEPAERLSAAGALRMLRDGLSLAEAMAATAGPAATEEPEVEDTVGGALQALLVEFQLGHYYEPLLQLGAASVDDLGALGETELDQLGFKLLERKRLLRAVAARAATATDGAALTRTSSSDKAAQSLEHMQATRAFFIEQGMPIDELDKDIAELQATVAFNSSVGA